MQKGIITIYSAYSPSPHPLKYTQSSFNNFSSKLSKHILRSRSSFCISGESRENSIQSSSPFLKELLESAPGHLSVINAQGFCWPQLSQSEHDSSSTSTKEKVNFRRDSSTSISSLAVISPGITTAA